MASADSERFVGSGRYRARLGFASAAPRAATPQSKAVNRKFTTSLDNPHRSVAQIFNLPYRRFVIGRTLLAGGRWQVKNLRYSRLQVCATGAAATLNTNSSPTGEGTASAGSRSFQSGWIRRTTE